MIDRGIIKWQPFDSCFNSNKVIHDLKLEKNLVNYPTLSEDQLELLEEEIALAYNLKLRVNITYYYNGEIKNIQGQIKYLDSQKKRLYLNDKTLYIKQILQIEEI